MVIDFHSHAFPDAIAKRAMDVLTRTSNNIPSYTDGTLSDTKIKMKSWGIDKFVICNIATNAKQQKNVNDFAINNNGGECIMFGSVYPFAPDVADELDRIKRAGLKGVKLHSEYQNFYADDKNVFPVYEKIRELGLIVVLHGGTDIGYLNQPVKCMPKAVKCIADNFKGIKLVMAHLGGFKETEETLEYICGNEIYLDTSVADLYMSKETVEKIVSKHGTDYLLFGSDCPWDDGGRSKKFIEELNIPTSKKEGIFYKNAKFLLGI